MNSGCCRRCQSNSGIGIASKTPMNQTKTSFFNRQRCCIINQRNYKRCGHCASNQENAWRRIEMTPLKLDSNVKSASVMTESFSRNVLGIGTPAYNTEYPAIV